MRVAYFTPVSPQKTGISDYSERELLPYLSKYVEIDIFIDKGVKPTNKFLLENFNVIPYTEFDRVAEHYDTCLYHMGNNRYHKFIYKTLLKYPGITVLHDIFLHGFLWSISVARGDIERYIEEYRYCYGEKGVEIARKALKIGNYPEFELPLIKRILDHSIVNVTHSEFAARKVIEEKPNAIVEKINQPITPDELDEDQAKVKKRLGLDKYDVVITSFGFISHHKRPSILVDAFSEFVSEYPNSILLFVGGDFIGIDRMISERGLNDKVVKTGYIPHSKALEYLAASDFCVNLRYPTAGETSRGVLQIMVLGRPVIVSNVGWFSELPNNCCIKIDVDSYEKEMLLEAMKLLASDVDLRYKIGENAKKYVKTEHDPERIAKEYYRLMERVLDGSEFIIHSISQSLSDVSEEIPNDWILRVISESISDFILSPINQSKVSKIR